VSKRIARGVPAVAFSESMPAEGQNDRLLPYAGKRVTVTGKVYAKGRSQALVIATISADGK